MEISFYLFFVFIPILCSLSRWLALVYRCFVKINQKFRTKAHLSSRNIAQQHMLSLFPRAPHSHECYCRVDEMPEMFTHCTAPMRTLMDHFAILPKVIDSCAPVITLR